MFDSGAADGASAGDVLATLSPEQREQILLQSAPDYWLEKRTGEIPWAKQVDIMHAVARYARVAVASGNGVGKTWLAARLVAWFLDVFYPATVVTTAPTTRQVKDLLWKEIAVTYGKAKIHETPLGGVVFTTAWNFPGTPEKHFGTGFAPKDYDPNRFVGYHNNHMLVIEDEAAGITKAVDEGINALLKGAHTRWLKIGNPTNSAGPFYEVFKSPDWTTFHVSEFESPNVDFELPPKLADEDLRARQDRVRAFLESRLNRPIKIPALVTVADILKDFNKWGEGHPLWQARVLGQFADRTEDTFIAMSWVERAAIDEGTIEGAFIDIGVDVARYGNDRTTFAAKIGYRPAQGRGFAYELHAQQSTMETVGRIVAFVRKLADWWKTLPGNMPMPRIRLKIDAVGLGAGVYDRCKEIFAGSEWADQNGVPMVRCYEMIENRTARDPIQYANAVTEWWALCAHGLENGDISGELFGDKRLMSELVTRKYKYGSDGRMRAESKEDMRSRGEDSPDFGDAVVIAFADVPMMIEFEPSSGMHAGMIYGR